VPSGGWGEIVVLYDEWRFVAEGPFGLAGYSDLCVRYDLLHTYHGALVICRRVFFAWYLWILARLDDAAHTY